jgi:LacI family transcriptional regulator
VIAAMAIDFADAAGTPAARDTIRASRPTLKTMSEITGLGVTTVSRALKAGPELRRETKARVQAVANELGYRPNRAGVRLRTGRTFVIGLIVDQNMTTAEFERRIILGVSRVLHDKLYHLVVLPQVLHADPMEPVRYFVETGAADGIIFTHTRPADERVRYLIDRDFPFITHGRTELGEAHPFYDFDSERFMIEAVELLVERGRRRLATFLPPRQLTCAGHMRDGFHKAIRDLKVEGAIIDAVDLDGNASLLRRTVATLMSEPDRPDGIICANEARCIALMAGIRDAGLTVGKDVDVIAKDTTDILDHITPAIDSFFEDLTLAGEDLGRLLLRRIAGAPVSELQSIGEPQLHRRT